MADARAPCRLLLVLETDVHGAGLELLEAALRSGAPAVAGVVLKARPDTLPREAELATAIKRIQSFEVVVLLAGDGELARDLGADGVHLPFMDDEEEIRRRYAVTRAAVGGELTVGASAGLSRHLAMVYGEIGADYVAFEAVPGATDASQSAGELATWWAPLFEVPVVALGVESAPEAQSLAAAGVDFVGVDLGQGQGAATARHVASMADAVMAGGGAR